MRLLRSRAEINPKNFAAYQELLDKDNPRLIREMVRWADPVNSLKEFDHNGNPQKVPIGKAALIETAADWYGTFDLEDTETMDIFRSYVGRSS